MRLFTRLSKFISIGLISTIVHYLALGFSVDEYRVMGKQPVTFTLAFMLSFSATIYLCRSVGD